MFVTFCIKQILFLKLIFVIFEECKAKRTSQWQKNCKTEEIYGVAPVVNYQDPRVDKRKPLSPKRQLKPNPRYQKTQVVKLLSPQKKEQNEEKSPRTHSAPDLALADTEIKKKLAEEELAGWAKILEKEEKKKGLSAEGLATSPGSMTVGKSQAKQPRFFIKRKLSLNNFTAATLRRGTSPPAFEEGGGTSSEDAGGVGEASPRDGSTSDRSKSPKRKLFLFSTGVRQGGAHTSKRPSLFGDNNGKDDGDKEGGETTTNKQNEHSSGTGTVLMDKKKEEILAAWLEATPNKRLVRASELFGGGTMAKTLEESGSGSSLLSAAGGGSDSHSLREETKNHSNSILSEKSSPTAKTRKKHSEKCENEEEQDDSSESEIVYTLDMLESSDEEAEEEEAESGHSADDISDEWACLRRYAEESDGTSCEESFEEEEDGEEEQQEEDEDDEKEQEDEEEQDDSEEDTDEDDETYEEVKMEDEAIEELVVKRNKKKEKPKLEETKGGIRTKTRKISSGESSEEDITTGESSEEDKEKKQTSEVREKDANGDLNKATGIPLPQLPQPSPRLLSPEIATPKLDVKQVGAALPESEKKEIVAKELEGWEGILKQKQGLSSSPDAKALTSSKDKKKELKKLKKQNKKEEDKQRLRDKGAGGTVRAPYVPPHERKFKRSGSLPPAPAGWGDFRNIHSQSQERILADAPADLLHMQMESDRTGRTLGSHRREGDEREEEKEPEKEEADEERAARRKKKQQSAKDNGLNQSGEQTTQRRRRWSLRGSKDMNSDKIGGGVAGIGGGGGLEVPPSPKNEVIEKELEGWEKILAEKQVHSPADGGRKHKKSPFKLGKKQDS
ncbi:putative transcriptional repressor salm [Balamuthia mandrillaris]